RFCSLAGCSCCFERFSDDDRVMRIVTRARHSTVLLVVACLTEAGCRQDAGTATTVASPPLAGQPIRVDGSATLLPISRALAVQFMKSKPTVRIAVSGSDTASGFQKLCAGEKIG